MPQTWQHSAGRLQPEAPDHRPGLSPVGIAGLSSVISEFTLHDIAKHIIAVELDCAHAACSVQAWMLSANNVRKHFPADISLAGLDGNSLLLNLLETRADSPPSLSQIEALRSLRRCATDATVIGIAIFGCVVWSHGTCGIQTSLCVSAEYIWPELRRFSVNTSCICLILTGAWFGALSRVCLHAYLPICCLRFRPSGYLHLYVKCCQPITEIWTVFPPGRTQIGIRRRPESPCTCS